MNIYIYIKTNEFLFSLDRKTCHLVIPVVFGPSFRNIYIYIPNQLLQLDSRNAS